jgi:hypothetical protein
MLKLWKLQNIYRVCHIMGHSRFHGHCKPANDKDFKVNKLTRETYKHSILEVQNTNLVDPTFPGYNQKMRMHWIKSCQQKIFYLHRDNPLRTINTIDTATTTLQNHQIEIFSQQKMAWFFNQQCIKLKCLRWPKVPSV